MVEHTKRSDAHDTQRTPPSPARQTPEESFSAYPDTIADLHHTLGNMGTQQLLSQQADASGAIPALQRAIGNAGVQLLIQRQDGVAAAFETGFIHDLKTKCISREYPKNLEDAQIQQGIEALRAHLNTLDPSDANAQAAADNLQILESEVEFRQRNKAMDDHLTDIVSAETEAARRQKTDELIAYTHNQLEAGSFPTNVETFIRQTAPDVNEKVRILGKVTVEAERMEFFLGNIYHRGADDWEVNAANHHTEDRGRMVDSYTGSSAMHWCSRFATTALSRVRGSNSVVVSSGYQVANSGEFAGKDIDYSQAYGGDFAGMHRGNNATAANNPWAALRQRLTQINDDETIADKPAAKRAAVDNVFNTEIRPQPGDMMIVTEPGANLNSFDDGHSHTTTIEQIDGYTISTIEGNASDRVTGYKYDLTDPAKVGKIVFIARPSLASGRNAEQEAQIGAGVDPGTAHISEQELLEPLLQMNKKLEEFAALAGYIDNVPAGGNHTVQNLD